MLHATDILCLGPPESAIGAQAICLARHLGATLHVMPVPASERGGATAEPGASGFRWEDVSAARDAPVPTRVVESCPDSVATVLGYVADASIDLVVIDTPPDRGPVPPLAAEVSHALIRRLDCPVFVVEQQDDPDAIRRILVPTDFSDYALQAFRHAVALARLYEASVDVLHVVDSLPYVALTPTDRLSLGTRPLSEHRGRRRLRAFLQEAEEATDVTIRPQIAYGDAAEQIIHWAGQDDVDLMVLSTQGRGGAPGAALGTVGERVLGRVTCPTLLLRTVEASRQVSPSNASSDDTA